MHPKSNTAQLLNQKVNMKYLLFLMLMVAFNASASSDAKKADDKGHAAPVSEMPQHKIKGGSDAGGKGGGEPSCTKYEFKSSSGKIVCLIAPAAAAKPAAKH
ncbi:MAG: hypothetical protein NT035_06995 [Burkholderiales bacterium]|jgi:hypothetical protein|nr:hypothetical protein [Burkholderiales bacterium]